MSKINVKVKEKMTEIKKIIEVTLPEKSAYESFSEDGCKTYCVRLNVVGIDHDIWMTVPGNNEDDACNIAMDNISSMDAGDCSVEETIKMLV